MNLDHLMVPENKEVLENVGHIESTQSQLEKIPNGQSWDNLSNKINDDSIGSWPTE